MDEIQEFSFIQTSVSILVGFDESKRQCQWEMSKTLGFTFVGLSSAIEEIALSLVSVRDWHRLEESLALFDVSPGGTSLTERVERRLIVFVPGDLLIGVVVHLSPLAFDIVGDVSRLD